MKDWSQVPWTEFQEVEAPTDGIHAVDPVDVMLVNSRYQVAVYVGVCPPFGKIAHLSFKVHDRSAYHDWRDIQRLKNEICGRECDAVEVYPAESKLVDTANQYHLYVFGDFKLPFGFQTRLVGDGEWNHSQQRPWPEGERPTDALTADQYDALVQDALAKRAVLAVLDAGDDDEI